MLEINILVCYIIGVHESVFFIQKNIRGVLMAKETKEKKKKGTEVEEVEVSTVKKSKAKKSESKKSVKKAEKQAILNEKKKIEDKIDNLVKDKKTTKEKAKKKELAREIKKLKVERKEIGKKDTYLRDVKKEMSMVRWPSRAEVVKYSLASLIFIVFFALFFFGIDALFALVKDLID